MKKVRVIDYPKECFNLVDSDDQGYFIEGEIIEERGNDVLISSPDYGGVYFPKELIEGTYGPVPVYPPIKLSVEGLKGIEEE